MTAGVHIIPTRRRVAAFLTGFGAAWLLLALAAPAAAAINLDQLDNPRAIPISDRAVENRWQTLFDPNPRWWCRQIAYIVRGDPKQYLTLLAARLIYRGGPWNRRATDDMTSNRSWRIRNADICQAVLRELRWHRDPSLVPVYEHFVAGETDPEQLRSALVSLWQLNPDSAKACAVWLADPALPDGMPGAKIASVRQLSVAFLIETFGIAAPESRQALTVAVLRGAGVERSSAIKLVPSGADTAVVDLLEQAALRLIAEHQHKPLVGEDQAALVLIGQRLNGVKDGKLVAGLGDLAVHAERALAATAATTLARGFAGDQPLPIADLAARAMGAADPVIRNMLLALLVRVKPEAVAMAAAADSPWRKLAAHRQQLAAWEWQGLVR